MQTGIKSRAGDSLSEDGSRVTCGLCPRSCRVKQGARGHCYVRRADASGMVLDTYGRSGGFAIDPIEKKPLYHFYPGSGILSFGTAGCNLACKFCQNWELSRSRKIDENLEVVLPEQIASLARSRRLPSVAFTYNDPVIFYEYAVDTAIACKEKGISPVAVTASYINEKPARSFFSVMDAANIDLKAFDDNFYKTYCGGGLSPVLRGIEIAREEGVWVEITNLLIPGLNDHPTEIHDLSKWIVHHAGDFTPLHFTAYHPDYHLMNLPATPPETLFIAREIAMNAGLKYVYTGNIRDEEGGITVCPRCKMPLIRRSGFGVSENLLGEDGKCPECGEKLDGVF